MNFLRRRLIALPVGILAVTAMLSAQNAAFAQSQVQTGAAQAKDLAGSIRPGADMDLFSVDAQGRIQLKQTDGTAFSLGATDLFPGAEGGNASALTNVYGNNANMLDLGDGAHSSLRTNTTSPDGKAYSTVTSAYQKSRPDLRNDPLWGRTDTVFNNLLATTQEFGECTTTTVFTAGTRDAHMPDYKVCERVVDETRTCTIRHEYKAGVLDHHTGPLNVQSCGAGCVEIWIGRVGDNYYNGNCQIFEESITVDIYNPDAVISATLEYAKWDDYMQVWLNGAKVWSGPDGNFPPETAGACELSTSWERNLNVDVTNHFKTDGLLAFRTRTSVSGDGEGFARIKVRYDPDAVVYEEAWSPADCKRALDGMTDGFCTGTATCSAGPAPDADGCAWIGGVYICPEHFDQNTQPVLNPLCTQATVNASCGFYKGQMDCWTDAQGQQQCPQNEGTRLNTCAAFEDNPSCGFISSKCVQNAAGQTGACYVQEEVWDCGHTAGVETVTQETEFNCPGPVECMGMACIDDQYEASADFAEAAAALSAAQLMAADTQCFEDNTQNNNCEIFKGEAGECKKAVGGIVNCCESPTQVSLMDYMTLISGVGKITTASGVMDKMPAVQGAWNSLTEPFNSAWESINKPLVQGWESLWGSSSAASGGEVASKGIMETIKQDLTNKVAEWTINTFGEQAGSLLFEKTVENGVANYALGGVIGTALSWAMTAYMIYQITMILIQIIWACTPDEFQVNAKRQLKSCHFVGGYCKTEVLGVCVEKRDSYCCFNSPLSRILQQQIRSQLSISWGTAEDPVCRGLTVTELQSTDFSKVDLSEWIGLLSETGQLPGPPDLSMDGLTGSGSALNTGGRPDAATRTVDRMNQLNTRDIRTQAGTELRGTPLPGSGGP